MNRRLQAVEQHPLHRYLGVTTIQSNQGCAEFTIEVNEQTLNPAGVFHGGVIYILCDVCAYAGLSSVLEDNIEAVTHDIQVSVMRAAQMGDQINFKSKIVRLGKRLCFIETVATVGNHVIATAKITKSILSKSI